MPEMRLTVMDMFMRDPGPAVAATRLDHDGRHSNAEELG